VLYYNRRQTLPKTVNQNRTVTQDNCMSATEHTMQRTSQSFVKTAKHNTRSSTRH